MTFILSTSTTVSAPFQNALSINTSINAQRQELYQLSISNPIYDSLVQYQTSISIAIYSPGPSYSTQHSVNCLVASPIEITINPGACGGSIDVISDEFYASAYSYKKDINTYGQESWSLVTVPKYFDDDLQNESYLLSFLRGVATGNSTDPESQTGVQFIGTTVESKSMSISAGFPGIGNAFSVKYGRVISIGGSIGPGDGDGQASVSIPYVPLITSTI